MLNGLDPLGEGQNWDGGLLASSTRPESRPAPAHAYIYMKVACSICGVEDWPAQIRNWHGTGRCVSTAVVNSPVVTNSLVTNSPDPVVTNKRSGNRHDKAAWRIYMREYMKAKRGRQA